MVAAVFLSVLCLSTPGDAQEPDLSGVWQMNWELSDNPRERAPDEVGGRNRDGWSGRGGGIGGVGGFGRGPRGLGRSGTASRGRDDAEDRQARIERARDVLADLLTAPRSMTIEQDRREVLLRYDDGRYVRIVPDDRDHAGIAGSTEVIRRARWQDGRLVAEIKVEGGPKVVHELELRLGGEQLFVLTTLPASDAYDEVELKRYYDRADTSSRTGRPQALSVRDAGQRHEVLRGDGARAGVTRHLDLGQIEVALQNQHAEAAWRKKAFGVGK